MSDHQYQPASSKSDLNRCDHRDITQAMVPVVAVGQGRGGHCGPGAPPAPPLGRTHQCLYFCGGCGANGGSGLDLLLQENGQKEITTWVKPLRALGFTGSTGGSCGKGGMWGFLPLATCGGSGLQLLHHSLSKGPWSSTVAPEKVWSHP